MPRVQRGHHPPPINNGLVGSFVLGAIQIHFCDTGVKTNGEVYRSMLNNVLSPVEEMVFKDEE